MEALRRSARILANLSVAVGTAATAMAQDPQAQTIVYQVAGMDRVEVRRNLVYKQDGADRPQMELVVRSGAISPQTVTAVATNHLVIIVPAGSARSWSTPAALASSQIRHVAVGDPNAVPAGVYAKDWLQRINLWRVVEPKLVPATSVRGALSAVRTGAVDAGIVYRTDARALDGISIVYEVTGSDAPRIEYPAGIVTGSRRGVEAAGFVEFLQSPPAQRILERWGFGTHVVATRNEH